MPLETDVRLLKYQCLGNGVVIGSQYSGLTGDLLARTVGMTATPTSISNLAYQWAADGNLTQRQDLRQSLLEGFTYDALNRLTQVTLNGTVTQSVGYDALGNITSRSDVGSYTYHPTRKHAVTQAGSRAFTYDANGNMLTRNGQTLAWRGDDLPALVRDQASSGEPVYQSEFAYGPNGERWRQIATFYNGTETTVSIAGLFEKSSSSSYSGTVVYRHWIPAPDGTLVQIAVARNAGPGSLTTRYITRDHLGSVDAVLSSTAEVINRESFNVWGSRRSATGWTGAPSGTEWAAIADTLRQGYTSDATNHTHLDNLGLIHMNGRVLDPTLGRFISADPSIPDPYSSQSWNRYSYVRNNYLSRIDPTGFEDEYVEEIFVTDTPIECQQWGVGYSGCPDPCVANPFGRGCPDLIHRNPYLQPGEPRDDDPAAVLVPQGDQLEEITVTAIRSFEQKLWHCTADHFGLTVVGAGLTGAGWPIPGTKPFVLPGSSNGTSLAGMAANQIFGDLRLPVRLPTVVGGLGTGRTLAIAYTNSAARFAGRAVPVLGEALLAYDAYSILSCSFRADNAAH